jgi:hypothetical protein
LLEVLRMRGDCKFNISRYLTWKQCGNFSEVLSNAVGIAAIGIAMIEWEEACG